jgi:hypothetical protein
MQEDLHSSLVAACSNSHKICRDYMHVERVPRRYLSSNHQFQYSSARCIIDMEGATGSVRMW